MSTKLRAHLEGLVGKNLRIEINNFQIIFEIINFSAKSGSTLDNFQNLFVNAKSKFSLNTDFGDLINAYIDPRIRY